MLYIISQKLDVHRKNDADDLIDWRKVLDDDFPHTPIGVGMPSPFPAEQDQKQNQDMSATMTFAPGPDRKLTIEEIQQQVSQLDATLTVIKKQLQELM